MKLLDVNWRSSVPVGWLVYETLKNINADLRTSLDMVLALFALWFGLIFTCATGAFHITLTCYKLSGHSPVGLVDAYCGISRRTSRQCVCKGPVSVSPLRKALGK